ncbi:hypothetical protein [uncultured Hyphomonas sp.]|uniref:hypothetical protein n=1 Tax=uncultured Hyphomonas sp. TaxID=225298 RepID=UPI002AAA8B66|nr:hypothetical protein [uncultured Hyphomonas sp.]
MPSDQAKHPLARRITDLGLIGYPVSDNIDVFLGALYEGQLYKTLSEGYPGQEIVLNLTRVYAEIGEVIFWGQEASYREALDAFPYLTAHIVDTRLGLADLYHVLEILESFFDWEPDGQGPDHLPHLNDPIRSLAGLFEQAAYKNAIYAALADKARPDFSELISMADWFYGEDVFDLFFSFAEAQPVRALEPAYWLIGINDDQRERFISWARSHMPAGLLLTAAARTQAYDETVTQILDRITWKHEHTLKTVRDRVDFTVWGLCSANKFKAANAAYLLEELPVSQWPEGSLSVISGLYEDMEPNWTSFKSRNGKGAYTTHKERLGELLKKANGPF